MASKEQLLAKMNLVKLDRLPVTILLKGVIQCKAAI